ESPAELTLLQQVAQRLDKPAAVSIRVNPDVDAHTHPYIATGLQENKFGIAVEDAMALYQHAKTLSHIKLHGIDCHIGSQITELAPFLAALDKVLALMQQLKKSGINLQHLNLGGGLGVRYHDEQPPHPSEYGVAIKQRLADSGFNGTLILEPGRAIAANAGILVTQVLYLKTNADKHFAIVDAGMNDLLRPALYQAWQEVLPVQQQSKAVMQNYDIVGPICETGDFIAKQRELALTAGDLLAVRGAGAYGFSMSSNYNSRPRVAEVLVDGDQTHLVRARESYEELFSNEFMLP
ncbi:MAG: diaminopimelate decarboxylase, partial [Gammaproteobacteria bacterium]|nr:diaminopimelate decarboxylase [Gammaproteobacteria bacterium]